MIEDDLCGPLFIFALTANEILILSLEVMLPGCDMLH